MLLAERSVHTQDELGCVEGGATYQGDGVDCADVECPTECSGSYPACDGECPDGQDCVPGNVAIEGGAQFINQCECQVVACGDSFPECNGECPQDQECVQAMIKGANGGGAQVTDQCECHLVEGACCCPSGECTLQSEQSCVDGGATYQGDNTDCANVDCPRLCGGSYPECDGECPEDEVCVPDMMNPATGGGAQFVNQCKCVAPDGSDCNDPTDCLSGNCVEDVCCDTACDQPGEICNLAGDRGDVRPAGRARTGGVDSRTAPRDRSTSGSRLGRDTEPTAGFP